jgi:hypothetical protein
MELEYPDIANTDSLLAMPNRYETISTFIFYNISY